MTARLQSVTLKNFRGHRNTTRRYFGLYKLVYVGRQGVFKICSYRRCTFSELSERGWDLENCVYYQGDTHYFVMTPKKDSLLKVTTVLLSCLSCGSPIADFYLLPGWRAEKRLEVGQYFFISGGVRSLLNLS